MDKSLGLLLWPGSRRVRSLAKTSLLNTQGKRRTTSYKDNSEDGPEDGEYSIEEECLKDIFAIGSCSQSLTSML